MPRSIAPLTAPLIGVLAALILPCLGSLASGAQPREEPIQLRRARAFVEAINAADADAYIAFTAEHRTPGAIDAATEGDRRRQYAEFVAEWGRMEIEGVMTEGPTRLRIEAMGDTGRGARFTFEFEDAPARRIEVIRIDAGPSAALEGPGDAEWASAAELLELVRERTGVPALSACVVREGEIVESAAVGVRMAGGDDPVRPDDPFHIGSVAKSVTATMIAALVERGVMGWDTTLAEALPDVPMRDEYKAVTVRMLLDHRAGIPGYEELNMPLVRRLRAYPGSPADKREAFVRDLLREEPVATPGTRGVYSNAGFTVPVVIAERATGRSWEELVRRHVFAPAGMGTAGFGWPATPEDPDAPRGHFGDAPDFQPRPFGRYIEPAALAPSGNVHASAEDMARYAILHLRGLGGEDAYFDASTLRAAHTPREGAIVQGEPYTCGWSIARWPGPDDECHWHDGSGGTFYCDLRLWPERDAAIVAMANAAGPAEDAAPLISRLLFDRWIAE